MRYPAYAERHVLLRTNKVKDRLRAQGLYALGVLFYSLLFTTQALAAKPTQAGSSDPSVEKHGSDTASLAFVRAHIPNAAKVGEGKLEVFIWKLYDACLFAPYGIHTPDGPHALRFDYLRAFSNEEMATSTIDQMRRHQQVNELLLAAWYNKLKGLMPGVDRSDSMIVIATGNGETLFYLKRKADKDDFVRTGFIRDRVFTKHFFDIWLGKEVEHPELRTKLLSSMPI